MFEDNERTDATEIGFSYKIVFYAIKCTIWKEMYV
jgi:hypothetical protein